jgi:hypothetical protein
MDGHVKPKWGRDMADRFRGQDHDNEYGGLDDLIAEDEYASEETYGGEDEYGGVHQHGGHDDMATHDEEAMQQEQGGMPPRADGDDLSAESEDDFPSDLDEDESESTW